MLCHEGDAGFAGEHVVRELIESGGIGWAGVRLAAVGAQGLTRAAS